MNENMYNMISNMTLGELVNVLNNKEQYKDSELNRNIINNIEKETTILYDTNELIESYPFFTKYNIKKAIEEENLPYITIGRKRLFEKKLVEKWLEDKYKRKKEYDF